jgi:hypothetical protein
MSNENNTIETTEPTVSSTVENSQVVEHIVVAPISIAPIADPAQPVTPCAQSVTPCVKPIASFVKVGLGNNIKCCNCEKIEHKVNDVIKQLNDILEEKSLNMLNIVMVCIEMMKIIVKVEDLTDAQQKDIIIDVLTKYLEQNEGDVTMVEMVPSFIDAAKELSNGNTKLAVEEVGQGCLSWLFSKKSKKTKK